MGLKSFYKSIPRRNGETPKQKFVRELSEECGVTPETVYRWINGTSRPDKLKQQRIAEMTNIPVDELFND
ncbi:helix-turn-helix domain-containing protein [Anaerophaga thermohalophila]|jgi:transcriptional regulator with XRE-family HTH domain|uniref:helix-turn-helix domain-containing protein n=1 Tax=Anaerophaga thermohalophila TaxID=177400 RepID=UPI000237C834|nr:helix-turn-helix transcriptional regulator [Anaerophaga thermohalophila]